MACLVCSNCPHRCRLEEGKSGLCSVREARGGELFLPRYGSITASGLDKIEKKPLAHFHPGSLIPSFGFAGCNLRCPFCQNWRISQNPQCPGEYYEPGELIRAVSKTGFGQIAYTYSEPLVHPEFVAECMELAHKENIANVLVTNGCCSKELGRELLRLTAAANIDLKCFSQEKYRNILGGDLAAVLDFIETAFSLGTHIEITTLIVTGFNDTIEEFDLCVDFIAGLSPNIPLHITAYHPAYRYDREAAQAELIQSFAQRAREKLSRVHTGNI